MQSLITTNCFDRDITSRLLQICVLSCVYMARELSIADDVTLSLSVAIFLPSVSLTLNAGTVF